MPKNTPRIRIGCDIINIPRFEKSLETGSFVEKVFHPHEIAYCESKKTRVSSYAARFAAKEAFSKALGTGLYSQGIFPKEIWVENEENGRPYFNFSDNVQTFLKSQGVKSVELSLSHHVDYAMASVVFA